MYKPSKLELRCAAAFCVSAALLLPAWPARAEGERADQAATAHLPIALVDPEPVLQLAPPGELGGGESMIQEPKFRSETRRRTYPNRPLLATGATVFSLSYLPSVIGAAVADGENDNKNDLYIPVAGPWMMMARGPEEERWEKTLLTISGVTQGLGALMLVSSLFIPQRVTERWYLIGSNGPVRLVPSRLATGYGVRALGRF